MKYRAVTRKMLLLVPQIPTGASNPTTLKIGYVGIITFPLPRVKRGFINMNYKQKIIEMVSQAENVDYLEFIYNMMMAFRKKWGI